MNLLMDRWLPVNQSGGLALKEIPPWQISDTTIMDIAAPRPDFQGALYQFLIGLLQTTFAPADQDEWLEYWYNPPEPEKLKAVFSNFQAGFELKSPAGGVAFLQDFDMPDGERKPIASLLIEAPGGKTLKDNLDHFIKGNTVSCMCESCAATALFALQTNAPSGGVGHRVGLRGGGPLTTLLIPQAGENSLWKKLWLNILSEEEVQGKAVSPIPEIFPWMAATRISDKTGKATLPTDVSSLQMYWGMPRRIRFEDEPELNGKCGLCGKDSEQLMAHFRTKNYGVNYEGPWVHPLTPYRFDPKNENPPLSLKGQQGGLGYRHWLSLNWNASNGDQSAGNVQNFNSERCFLIGEEAIGIWCFGYDMDNMKARCWYEQQMPVVSVEQDYQQLFIHFVSDLIDAAKDVVSELRTQVKAAWFSRPKDVKGDTSIINASFWQATEAAFYQQLYILAAQPENTRNMPILVAQNWLKILRVQAEQLFDHWVLEGEAEDMDMKRITRARRILLSKLKTVKSLKNLEQITNAETEAV